MATEQQILGILREMHLFGALDDAGLKKARSYFDTVSFRPQEEICKEGVEGNEFFILIDGNVAVSRWVEETREHKVLDVLDAGDFFGEESLLFRRLRSATVTALTPVTAARADRVQFEDLIEEFPQVKTALQRIIDSHRMARSGKFPWLNEEEVVYQIRRKHVAFLLTQLMKPLLVFLLAFLALGISGWAYQTPMIRTPGLIIGLAALLISSIWAIWLWIDWGNDYYVVTNQRVAWIESVLFLYESQVEAPLNTIMAVDMDATLWGRMFGFGNVFITTYTGKVPFQNVADPHQMIKVIEEYWHRIQRRGRVSEQQEVENAVWKAMGHEEKVKTPAQPVAASPTPAAVPQPESSDSVRELSVRSSYFSNIFRMRFEEGNTITYRKHWLILLRKTLFPVLTGLVLTVLCVGYTTLYFNTPGMALVSPAIVIGLWLFLMIVVVFPWWLYNYVDWRNDIYQITDKNIFDIERKPLGTETRKSASLENILSLEHRRPGCLGYIFNVGIVVINVGETKLDFVGVYEPSRIQRDVFNRIHMLRLQKQRATAAQERERVINLLSVYHRNLTQWLVDENKESGT